MKRMHAAELLNGVIIYSGENSIRVWGLLVTFSLLSIMIVKELYEPRHEKTNVLVFDMSDTNRAVQSQKIARGLKFRFKKVEGLYYLCSENKGADHVRGYREADLRLCFRICKMLVFS